MAVNIATFVVKIIFVGTTYVKSIDRLYRFTSHYDMTFVNFFSCESEQ